MSDEDNEKIDSPNDSAGSDNDHDDSGAQSDDVEKLKEQNKKLFERAKKAEGFSKDTDGNWVKKPKPAEPPPAPPVVENKNNLTQVDPIELAKTANVLSGMSDNEIEELQAVARAKNLSLAAAKKDPLFQAWHTKFLEDAKKERSKMGGSNSSSQAGADDEPIVKAGMSRDEHRKLVESMGVK